MIIVNRNIFIFFIFTLLTSCTPKETKPAPLEKEKEIRVIVSVPAGQYVTRTISGKDENTIETLDILSFDEYGNLDYHTPAILTDENQSGTYIQYFIAKVKSIDRIQTFVLISNARNEIEEFISIHIKDDAPAISKEELFRALKKVHSNGAKWKTDKPPYERFPMWGESKPMIVEELSSITVSLLRMVSRIDVRLTDSPNNFKLESVSLWNAKREGHIVPDTATIVSDDNGKTKALKASADAETATHSAPLRYIDAISNGAITGTIYTFESAATDTHRNATCLVIGGTYKLDSEPTYYRIDLFEPDGTTYRDIIRNHWYTIQITKVKGSGYATEAEAFNSKAINLTTEIIVWDEADMNHIIVDGQYHLSVNKKEWLFTREARNTESKDNKLIISTDFPDGWKAICSESWLTLSAYKVGTTGQAEISIFTPENGTKKRRTGYITISAGRLEYIIEVVQNTSIEFDIKITDKLGEPVDELIFGNTPSEQVILVEYKPAVSNAMNQTYPIFGLADGTARFEITEEEISPGTKKYRIATTENLQSVTEHIGLKFEFEISYDNYHLSENIYLYQRQNYAIFDALTPEVYGWPYNRNSNENLVSILSNTVWTLSTDDYDMFGNLSHPATGEGESYFALGNNRNLPLGGNDRSVTLILETDSNRDSIELVVSAIHAALNQSSSTVSFEQDLSNTLAILDINIPKSAYIASVINVTSDADWLEDLRIDYGGDMLYLRASHRENTEENDRTATITIDFGLEDLPTNKLYYTLTQLENPFIDLPEFGWIMKEDSNYSEDGGNNWYYAITDKQNGGACPSGTYLPSISELSDMYTKLQSVPNKADYNFLPDRYYWSSTEEGFIVLSNAWIINMTNGATESISKNNPGGRVRCIKATY